MKRKYIKVLSVILVFAVSAVLFCFSASARQVEGAQVGGNGVVSGNPIYDNNDGYVFNENTYLLNNNNINIFLNGYSMSHAIGFTNNPLFSNSSPFYVTEYQYGGYYGTPNKNAIFSISANESAITGMAKSYSGYEQRYTLAFASNFEFPSLYGPLQGGQIRLQCNVHCRKFVNGQLTDYFSQILNFTPGEVYGIDLKTEGFFTGSIVRDFQYVVTGISILSSVDMTDTESFDAGNGYFFLGNFIAENVSSSQAEAPSYLNPNNQQFNDSITAEENLDSLLESSINNFGDVIGDSNNIIIADGLYAEFALIKDFLGRIISIDIFYKLLMVAACFGLLVFLINLGGKLFRSISKDGD